MVFHQDASSFIARSHSGPVVLAGPAEVWAWHTPCAILQDSAGQAGHPHAAPCPCRTPGPSSKFRHAQGTVLHRDSHITNLKGLNLTTPGESDGFCANRLRVAVPLLSSGGQVAVLEVRAPPHYGCPPSSCRTLRALGIPSSPHSLSTNRVPDTRPASPLILPAAPCGGATLIPILQMRAVRHREV